MVLREKWKIWLYSLQVPEPVFFASLEASSAAEQGALERALDSLAREDPTFRWRTDPETGQILVSGMGELHLQIMSIRVQRVSSAHSSREVQASTWTIPLSRK